MFHDSHGYTMFEGTKSNGIFENETASQAKLVRAVLQMSIRGACG